jgi:PleD family two-component response regulator
MASLENTHIYAAIRKPADRSQIEDELVLDGADISVFSTASQLWSSFQKRPARFIITDRRFDENVGGLDLVRQIRSGFQLPYVYVLMRSVMNQMSEIEEGLAMGVDDYLIVPHSLLQLRSRILVGLRWLTYIDSLTWKSSAASLTASPQ